MTDPVKEQLSAWLDGELPEAELDLLLKQVGRDSGLRAAVGRYALIGEALRSPGAVAAPAEFSKRVAAAIAAEPELNVPARPGRAVQWLRPAAGFAVAAGVATVAILGLRQPTQEAIAPTVADAAAPLPAPVVADAPTSASYIVPSSTPSAGYVPATRLTNYVVAHSEYSSPLGRRSVLSGVLAEDASDAAEDAAQIEVSQPNDDASQP